MDEQGLLRDAYQHVMSVNFLARALVVIGISLIAAGFFLGKRVDAPKNPTDASLVERPAPEEFEAIIKAPSEGARVKETFTVSVRVANRIEGFRYRILTADDFDMEYWPQDEVVLNENGDFELEVMWPIKDPDKSRDSATVVLVAVDRSGLDVLASYLQADKDQRPKSISRKRIIEDGKAIIIATRHVLVTR